MNLQSISRLPAEAFAPLGKSRRQQAEEAAAAQPKPAHQPTPITAPPGYCVTPQGGLRRNDQAPMIPEVKGRLLKAEPALPRTLEELDASEWWEVGNNQERLLRLRGGCNCCVSPPCFNCTEPITQDEAERLGLLAERDDIDLMLQIVDAAGEADKRTGSTDASDAVMSRFSSEGVPGASSVPPERREECIAALKAIRADDTATCGVVPSDDDLDDAWCGAGRRVGLIAAGRAVDSEIGRFWKGFWRDIPAERRADVIRALNALGV